MAQVEILAREFVFKIEDPNTPDTFLDIVGVDSFTHNPTKTDADTGHFGAAGRARHIVAERGDEFTLTIKHMEDDADGSEAEGNAALRELGTKIGHESIGTFQILGPSGNGIQFNASANVGRPAGARNDPATYDVTLTVTGDITTVSGDGEGEGEGEA